MLVGLMVPFAGPAAAVGTAYTPITVPTVEDDTAHAKLGSFQIEIDPMYSSVTSEAWIELPQDYEIYQVQFTGLGLDASNAVTRVTFTDQQAVNKVVYEESGKYNTFVTVSDKTKRGFKLSFSGGNISGQKFRLLVEFTDVKVPAGASGDIKATIKNISGQLVDGSVVIGKIAGGGLQVAAVDTDTFSDAGGYVKIRLEETVAGKLNAKDELKLELPDGFEWGDVNINGGTLDDTKNVGAKIIYGTLGSSGDVSKVKFISDGDTLKMSLVDDVYKSTDKVAIDFWVPIKVTDTSKAKYGDVIAKVKGDYTVSPSEIIVGTYGEYKATVSAKDSSKVVYAGQHDQEVSDIKITEAMKESLVPGRTITLTLPPNARWWKIDDQRVDNQLKPGDSVDEDSGIKLVFKGLEGTDDRTAKFTVELASGNTGKGSTDKAELTIENITVDLQAGYTGDLVVEVGGSAGVSGRITVAKVVNPVTVTAEKTNVQLGKANQVAGKITITEQGAGAIDTDDGKRELVLGLPSGVKFSSKPEVKVTKGDIEIDQVSLVNDDRDLKIKFKDDSNEASTIEISGIYYDIDRTVGEGDIQVKVGGPALVITDTEGYDKDKDGVVDKAFFPGDDYVVKVVNATVVTPAPSEARQTAVFTINSTTYTVNGVQSTMDVAPYIKDSRTYLPIRYVAYALGISPENVIWDGVKATFIGQGRVVQVTPGSAILSINGAPVTMDVVAEVVNGRVMVPFRWVAQAFGAQVDWDEATQTVTMKL